MLWKSSRWRKKRKAAKLLLEEFDDFTIAKKVELDQIQVYWTRREN